jgi:hypothetical protein
MTDETKAAKADSDAVLTDEEFALLDDDGDGVVHIYVEQMKASPDPQPVEPPEETVRHLHIEKMIGGAPSNKDAGTKRDEAEESDEEPEPIGRNLRPDNGKRRGR